MAIIPNENLDARQQIIDYTRALKKEMILKSLLALIAIVVGVAAIIFLNGNYVAVGIGIILIASLAIYQYSKHYHQSRNIFMRAANAIPQIG